MWSGRLVFQQTSSYLPSTKGCEPPAQFHDVLTHRTFHYSLFFHQKGLARCQRANWTEADRGATCRCSGLRCV
jgi:hypothetical protein